MTLDGTLQAHVREKLQATDILDFTGRDQHWRAADYAREIVFDGVARWCESQTSPYAPAETIADRLLIVTAGNYKFRPIILKQLQNAECLGHRTVVYDLAGLGLGQLRPVENHAFHKDGRYCKLANGWPSKGLHKPGLIADCLGRMTDPEAVLVYLDADAVPVQPFQELCALEFDVAVVFRPLAERKAAGYSFAAEMGQVNAGVLMFRPTPKAKDFIALWARTTDGCGGDQLALNRILPKAMLEGELRDVNGCRIRMLASKFNCAFAPTLGCPEIDQAAVVHFKSRTWTGFAALKHFPALCIPDHRRAAALKALPCIAGKDPKSVLLVREEAVTTGTHAQIAELADQGWNLKKIWVDDRCAPTLYFERMDIVS